MAGGRPTKYSAEIVQRICVHLMYGATLKIAAESEGIAEATAYLWLDKHSEFVSAVTEAKASARSTYLRNMALAANRGNVEACKWMLERLEPDTFGPPKARVEHSTPDGQPLEVAHRYESERPARVADILAEAGVIVARAGGLGDEPPPD